MQDLQGQGLKQIGSAINQGLQASNQFFANQVQPYEQGIDRLSAGAMGNAQDPALLAEAANIRQNAQSAGTTVGGIEDLAMDEASRLARAKQMGFNVDQPVYHGTNVDNIKEFKTNPQGINSYGEGVYFSDKPSAQYGKNTIPAYVRDSNPIDLGSTANADSSADISHVYDELGIDKKPLPNRLLVGPKDGALSKYKQLEWSFQKANDLKSSEAGTKLKEALIDSGFTSINSDGVKNILDPSNIRHINAAFNPAESSSKNILAAGAGAITGAAALSDKNSQAKGFADGGRVNSLAGTPPPPGLEESLQGAPMPASANPLTGTPPPEGIEDAIYGDIPHQALAGAAAAARGFTLGGSDLALTKSGLVEPETLKNLSAANPGTNLLGNLAGAGALTYLTGGAAAPIEGAVASQGIAPLAARAIGYGAEGAVFGAGNAVSDYALGDPHLNAQKIAADVGLGALFGAGLGTISHGLFSKKVADIANEANSSAETASALSSANSQAGREGGTIGGEVEKTPLFSLVPVDKKVAPELRAIGDKYDLPVTNGMTSAIKSVQQATDVLVSGAPTIARNIVEGELNKGWNGAVNVLNGVLDTGSDFGGGEMTPKQLGEALQGSLKAKIAEDNAPIAEMFNATKDRGIDIPVNPEEIKTASSELMKNPNMSFKGSDARLINQVNNILPTLDTAQKVSDYQAFLKNEHPFQTTTQNERYILGQVQDHLQKIFESSVEKSASNPSLPEDLREGFKSLVPEIKAARAKSAEFKQKFDPVIEQLGGRTGTGKGAAYMRNFVDEIDPEKFATKLFDKKYSGFNEHFAEEFPEESALMRQYMKQTLKQKALSENGQLDPTSLFKQIFGAKKSAGLEPEIRSSIFHEDELEKLQDMKKYLSEFPKKFNPSGTEGAIDFRAGFSPTGAALSNARDFGILAYIKAAGRDPNVNPFQLGADAADKFNKMSAIQKITDQFDKKMASSIRSIFSSSDAGRGAIMSAGGQGIDKGYDKVTKSISNIADNPSGIVDHMAHHTAGLNNSLPNVTQGINNTAMSALQFLNSKIPKPATNFPYSQKFEPSQEQKNKFMRYYTAVNNPLHVLDDVRNGTLTNESLEAMQAVHPQLLKQMQMHVSDQLGLSKNKDLSYAKKISIAKFIGHPLDQSMLPQVIMANQMALSGPTLQKQGVQKEGHGNMSALSKANLSGRAQTETRRLEKTEN